MKKPTFPQFQSLRTRLLFTYVALTFLGSGLFTLWVGQQFALSTLNDYANGVRVNALVVAAALVEPIEDQRENRALILTIVDRYESEIMARITLLTPNGEAWLDSTTQIPTYNLSQDAEIVAARNNQPIYTIRQNEQGTETIYTAAPIIYETDLIGYVRLAVPTSIPQTAVRERSLLLGSGFLLVLLLTTGVSLALAATLTNPLIHLQDTALKIASGDFSKRVTKLGDGEIGAVGNAFNHMAEQLQTVISEQQAFAGNAAHELRTPLTTIRLRTEALIDQSVDDATATQYIKEIDSETSRMGRLIDDLSLLARLDSARFTPSDELIDPQRLLRLVVREMLPLAEEKMITLTLNEPSESSSIQANTTHLRAVVRNLIENGIKYTGKGGQVNCTLMIENDRLKLTVSDNGQGISPEDLPHVHKRFYRADKGRSRIIAGSGLGLALVQTVVTQYNGRFLLTSDGLNQGTTAVIYWPLSK